MLMNVGGKEGGNGGREGKGRTKLLTLSLLIFLDIQSFNGRAKDQISGDKVWEVRTTQLRLTKNLSIHYLSIN